MNRKHPDAWVVGITGMNAKPDNPGPGMAVARCLSEASDFNGRIVGLSYDALDPGLYMTRYCDASYLLPYPSAGKQVLLERLEYIQATEGINVLIPCLDSELLAFAQLRPQLEAMGIKLLLPSIEQLGMRNKDRLPEIAQLAGIQSPDVKRIIDPTFFSQCQSQGWLYPLVVKGIFYDAYVVRTPEQGVAAFHKIAAQWGMPVLVQRFVEGEEVNLSAIGDGQGNMLGAVMMKKRAITDKGKAWAGISIVDEKLQQASARFIATTKWPGPLEVEVMIDRAGRYHLIEINPRFPAWIYLSVGVGRNLPKALLDLIVGAKPADFPEPRPGTLFIRYAEEVIVSLSDYESVVMQGSFHSASHPIGE